MLVNHNLFIFKPKATVKNFGVTLDTSLLIVSHSSKLAKKFEKWKMLNVAKKLGKQLYIL